MNGETPGRFDDLRASETRYRRLFESSRDGILILDARSRKIIDANPYMEQLLDYSRADFLGKELWEIGLLKDEKANADAFRQLQEKGYIRYEGLPLETKSGKRREVEFVSNVYEEAGRQVVQCNIRDISERKRTETETVRLKAELDAEKARLQHIFDNSPAFIVALRGPDFTFEMVNPAYYRLVGRRQLIGIRARDALPELMNQGFSELINRVYKTGEPYVGNEIPVRLQSPDDEERAQRYVNFVYTPLRESDGSISGVLSYGVDVTEQVLSRIKIEESEERYRFLFKHNPLPMWIFDLNTLAFLSVNDAAIEHYGYSEEEFLSMTLADIRPSEDIPALMEVTKETFSGINKAGVFRHRKRDGTIIYAEIISTQLKFNGTDAELVLANDVTERHTAEEALRQAEADYRSLVESSPAIVYLAEPTPPFAPIYVSPNIEKFGYTTEEWHNRPDLWLSLIHEDDRQQVLETTEAAMRQGLDTDIKYRIVARDGSVHWLHDKGRFVSDNQGKRVRWQGVILDITETKELEEQLRLSQKLESVGRLAGGIAHDFNNMLTVINGYSDLTLRKLDADSPLRINIEEIKKAGERSALLTHQLLAFSRQQVLQPVVLDLNEVVTDTIKLLQRLIGEDVELVTALKPEAGRVSVDPGQLSQILMNLAVNARDAMPHGGKLTIETANVFIEPDYARQKVDVKPGAYVLLAVCDTGGGMNDEIRQHIFEPFFTTKEIGKGTGLGLSTVYGIVKQSNGNIEIESEQGVGTTFRVFLPRVAEQTETARSKEDASTESLFGTETILLVEDEEIVRKLSRKMLESCGYTVVEARDGLEAFGICEGGDCKFDLLLTDVVMPQMGGRELAEKLAERLPEMQILFTSGYTDDEVVRHGVIETNTNFIQKPFTFDALARKVRQLLDAADSKARK